ncbi:hypothetical protein GCM10027416_05210 [Okibacterium endophyticum]
MPSRLSREERARFAWQLSFLLYRTTRLFGLLSLATAFVCLLMPGAVELSALVTLTLLLSACVVSHLAFTSHPRPLWLVGTFSLNLCSMVAIAVLPGTHENLATMSAVTAIAAGANGSLATVLMQTRGQLLVVAAGFLTTAVLAVGLVGWPSWSTAMLVMFLPVGWGVCAVFGVWLTVSFPRVMRRVANIGGAYNVERRASETEAQRHRNARLLHDTALATLTLLAHSGVGVSHDSLRAQAASDGLLLRRLRLGETPSPHTSGEYALTNTAELDLGVTLDSLRHRFTGTGLEIDWHGSGQLGLPADKLDAFVLALTECLENVRRHSGETAAHVTLSDDGRNVRAVVTDAGVGFDPDAIPGDHLGFAESVVGRMHDAGGSVRVFSAPGAGTTVMLEVPK